MQRWSLTAILILKHNMKVYSPTQPIDTDSQSPSIITPGAMTVPSTVYEMVQGNQYKNIHNDNSQVVNSHNDFSICAGKLHGYFSCKFFDPDTS
jgi:hypothetical protein